MITKDQMQVLSASELHLLLGGRGCMESLQEIAGNHQNSGNRSIDDAFWDAWADEFERCAQGGMK